VSILSSDKKVSALVTDALLLGIALALSYLEAVVPMTFLPLPGFRIGLANIAITVAAFRFGPFHALGVSLARILLVFFLFGSPTSLLFSLCGSALVLAALFVFTRRSFGFSFLGISVACAFLHNLGQLVASVVLVGKASLSYFPFLCVASLLFGSLNGVILNLLPPKILFLRGQNEKIKS